MKKKPLLLLDVDGVLCPFGVGMNAPLGYSPKETPGGMLLWVSHYNTHYLRKLSEYFELTWASMWESHANSIVGPLHSLPDLPYVSFQHSDRIGSVNLRENYKLAAIEKFVGSRPFAWVDDTIDESVVLWAEQREQPTLVLPVRAEHGFDKEAFQRLQEFGKGLNDHSEGVGSRRCSM